VKGIFHGFVPETGLSLQMPPQSQVSCHPGQGACRYADDTVDCVQRAATRAHVKRVTITPGAGNFPAISVKLSGSRPAFPIRMEIRIFNCVAKNKANVKHIGAKSLRMVKYGL
jgi:hypothetical protein